jgi:hypothetical protein
MHSRVLGGLSTVEFSTLRMGLIKIATRIVDGGQFPPDQ